MTSNGAKGLIKFPVPTATAVAPARIYSIASSQLTMPPIPTIGRGIPIHKLD